MSYLIESCIFPIIDGQNCVGQGFVVSGYFITAAHVIRNYPKCYIRHQGQTIVLSELIPLYMGKGDMEKDSRAEDVAIYSIEGMRSFFHLSDREVGEDVLKSYCVFLEYDRNTGEYYNSLSAKRVKYEGEDGNNIYCKCNRYKGSSGSPLVIGTEVVGIMHGGDERNICAFLKTSTFMLPKDVPYEGKLVRMLSKNKHKPDEPWTPEYFNRRAREQMGDAFDGESNAIWNID